MSNRVRSFTVVLTVLVLLGLVAGPASAGSKTYVTATECFLADLDPGREFFPEGRYHIRGAVSQFSFEASDPRLDGAVDQITANANFSFKPEPVYVSGPMWGTFVITNEGGSWEGTWTGVREKNGFSYFHYVGSGTGGYEGLQLRLRGERLDPDPSVPESFTGYILESGD